MTEPSPDLTTRMRQARVDHEARVQAVADGTADPEVYEALQYAYEGAEDALRISAMTRENSQ